jgi:hypothetical protein
MRGPLVVESAQRRARQVGGDVRLCHLEGGAGGRELVATEDAREGAALVAPRLEVDQESSGNRGRAQLHAGGSETSSLGTATTNRPPQSPIAFICSTISERRFQGRMRT